jgi:hypothetical protein
MRTIAICSALTLAVSLAACGGSDGDDTAGDDTAGDDTAGDDSSGDDSSGDDTAADPDAASGVAVMMTFSVTNGVRQSPNLDDPLLGTVYGQVFLSSEVTLTGPIEGATEYASVEVPAVDLRDAETAGSYTSPGLPPGAYTFLGFYDVDGNGATDRSPDAGDPVTIPVTNTFEIPASGATVQLTVAFDFVFN